MSVLKVENLNFTYGKKTPFEKQALCDISFNIDKQSIIGIIGHTGSGKSTLMQTLNGLIKPDNGTIYFEDKNIWEDKKRIRSVRFDIGLVFQYPEYQLFEETVEKDIAYGPKNMGLTPQEIDERVKFAAEIVGLSEKTLAKSPFDLSGGQKRRAAMAGIISMKPKVIILDEPTAGLDPKGRRSILTKLSNYSATENITMIIVSHSMEEIAELCNYVYVLNKGKIAFDGTAYEVYSNGDLLRSYGLNVPVMTQIAEQLKSRGYDLKGNINTIDDMSKAIVELLARGANNA